MYCSQKRTFNSDVNLFPQTFTPSACSSISSRISEHATTCKMPEYGSLVHDTLRSGPSKISGHSETNTDGLDKTATPHKQPEAYSDIGKEFQGKDVFSNQSEFSRFSNDKTTSRYSDRFKNLEPATAESFCHTATMISSRSATTSNNQLPGFKYNLQNGENLEPQNNVDRFSDQPSCNRFSDGPKANINENPECATVSRISEHSENGNINNRRSSEAKVKSGQSELMLQPLSKSEAVVKSNKKSQLHCSHSKGNDCEEKDVSTLSADSLWTSHKRKAENRNTSGELNHNLLL